jgi:hypothetical protein
MKYIVIRIERKDSKSFEIYARPEGFIQSPDIFLVQKDGELLKAAQQAKTICEPWDVPMDKFTTKSDDHGYHEELVPIDIESIVKNALKIATKARFSDVNSAFTDFCSDEQLLENVKEHLEGDNKLYEANIATMLNGRVYKNHYIKPLYAVDDDEAFKVALSVLQQRERRDVREEDLLACEIKCLTKVDKPKPQNTDSMKEMIYANKKLQLQKHVISPLYKFTHREEYKMYQEALTFENGTITVSTEELTVRKTDGTEFHTSLRHTESDFMTETYEGVMNGNKFRFLTSGGVVKTLGNNMVSFASISTSGWAVHYDIK